MSMLLVVAFGFLCSVSALILNVTIDDTLGDERTGRVPQYAPDWNARSVGGAPCQNCVAQPDGTHALKGTWHDWSIYANDPPATISLDFSGTRIYVYFILFNNIGTVDRNTRLRFYLDGSSDAAGDLLHLPDPTGARYQYNQLVFDSKSLALANHTLLVSSYSDGTTGSLALFDYAVYTTEDGRQTVTTQAVSTQSPEGGSDHSSPRVRIAIGSSIAGGLVAAFLLGAGYWVHIRRRQRRDRHASALGSITESHTQAATVEPFGALPQTDAVRYRERTNQELLVPPSLDDSAQLRSELGWVREELERVRRIAEPPDYTHASRDSMAS